MKIRYTVASSTEDTFPVEAMVAGKPVQARIPGRTVEMVSEDGSMGHTFRFADSEEFDTDQLVPGAVVVASFTVEKAAPKKRGK